MSRAKIQKKSMFIDMTAMSDVTVLLLTFFMLTASFVKKSQCKSLLLHPFLKSKYQKLTYCLS